MRERGRGPSLDTTIDAADLLAFRAPTGDARNGETFLGAESVVRRRRKNGKAAQPGAVEAEDDATNASPTL